MLVFRMKTFAAVCALLTAAGLSGCVPAGQTGTGAQLDFSVVLRSSRLKLMPHSVMPFLYLILLNGIAASNTHFSLL